MSFFHRPSAAGPFTVWSVAVAITVTTSPGCRPASNATSAAAPDATLPAAARHTPSPMETLENLRSFRHDGKLSEIEPYLRPADRSLVVAQLRSVDRLIAAANLLQSRVFDRFGRAAAQRFDRFRQLGNTVGVFSTDVTLLSERVSDDRAVVTYQVADRLPVDEVKMSLAGRRWMLESDPIDGVPEQILKLAFLLERMAEKVTTGELSVEELEREIALRQKPILYRLDQLVSAPDGAGKS